MRRGGAPAYPYPERSLPDGRPVGPVADTAGGERRPWVAEGDASLLEWTRQQLAGLADGPGLPSMRCSAAEWDRFTGMEVSSPATRNLLLGIQGEMLAESREWQRGQEPRDQVFISYRGGYWAEVEELAEDVRAGRLPGAAARPVKAVRPGELALERELLSEGRRWMLFSLLDDMLRSCTELWVYETSDYLKSWWALAELTAAAYIDNGERPALALSGIRPSSRQVTPAGAGYRVSLAQADRQEIARLMSNSRPDTVYPELPPCGAGSACCSASAWADPTCGFSGRP